MKISVTGFEGRLGSELIQMGCIPLKCDITEPDQIQTSILDVHPDVIINCAAYTDVDGAENEKEFNKAIETNLWGIERLQRGFPGKIIHISTDYVFNDKKGPYRENYDKYNPVNMYASSKVGGEIAFLTENREGNILVRTTGLYGGSSGLHDFTKLVIGSLSEGKSLQITKELRGNQTYIPHLVEALLDISMREDIPKIINIGSKEVINRYDFALMVAGVFDLDKSLITHCKNSDITSWVAERPKKGGVRINLAKKLKVPIYTILEGLKDLKEKYECQS